MATLSEAYKDIQIQLQHIIPPDFHSLKGVPESHTWPQVDDFPPDNLAGEPESLVPTVDLDAPNAAELIGDACQTWGVFQLTNHGVPLDLIGGAESQARRLFALPTQRKLMALRPPAGATGYGASRIAQFFSKLLWHEGFTIVGSPLHHARALWPLQDDHGNFCEVMENYQEKMKTLSHKLFLLMLKWLQVPEEELKWPFSMAEGALQLNSYPACPDPKKTMGLAPHTDSMLLTILHQTEKGLQIFSDRFGWVAVPPVAGALVVNLGNMMEIFSNGRFQSVMHRVFVNQFRHRISIGYFYLPPADSVVGPFGKFECPVYRSLMVKEYLQIRNKHREDSLSVVRVGI